MRCKLLSLFVATGLRPSANFNVTGKSPQRGI